jgi:Tol biopolymer transport system component
MARISACWSPSFSPDGTRIAFVSNLNDVPQVWTVSAKSGWPMLVTTLDDPVENVTWSPDGQWLAFSVAPGGGMNQQIYLVRPDGAGIRLLTDGGKENNQLNRWSHDGHWLCFASNRNNPETMDAYTYDVKKGERRLLARNPGIGRLTDISRDRNLGILYRMQSRSDNNLFLLDLGNSRETLVTPHEGPGSFNDGQFSPDGSKLYFSTNKDRDLIGLARGEIRQGLLGTVKLVAGRNDGELQSSRLARMARRPR